MPIVGLANLIRFQNSQKLYFLVTNLELYSYHKTQYDGIVKEVLDLLDFIQESIWQILSEARMVEWVRKPFPLKSYNFYTDPKYL